MPCPTAGLPRWCAAASKSRATGSPTCTCGGVGPGHTALIAAVVSDHPQAPQVYKARLAGIEGLSHVTVEVHRCEDGLHAA